MSELLISSEVQRLDRPTNPCSSSLLLLFNAWAVEELETVPRNYLSARGNRPTFRKFAKD